MNERWIRSPAFDAVWIMSGIPLGLIMVVFVMILPDIATLCGPPPHNSIINIIPRMPCDPEAKAAGLAGIYVMILFDLAHTLSPVCLAWGHREFRAMMLRQPLKFIGVPLVLLLSGAAIGVLSLRYFPDFVPFRNVGLDPLDVINPRLGNPFWWFLATYVVWNTYHFAKQNFGILTIYKIKSGVSYPDNQRRLDLVFCFVVQIVGLTMVFLLPYMRGAMLLSIVHYLYTAIIVGAMVVVVRDAAISGRYWTPRIIFSASQAICLLLPGILVFAANGLNHWLSAIGLASHVDSNRNNRSPGLFVAAVIVLGMILFWGLFWNPSSEYHWNLRLMMKFTLPYVGIRLAIGMWHFLQDRWIWRLSDPRVRETIGVALFS